MLKEQRLASPAGQCVMYVIVCVVSVYELSLLLITILLMSTSQITRFG